MTDDSLSPTWRTGMSANDHRAVLAAHPPEQSAYVDHSERLTTNKLGEVTYTVIPAENGYMLSIRDDGGTSIYIAESTSHILKLIQAYLETP